MGIRRLISGEATELREMMRALDDAPVEICFTDQDRPLRSTISIECLVDDAEIDDLLEVTQPIRQTALLLQPTPLLKVDTFVGSESPRGFSPLTSVASLGPSLSISRRLFEQPVSRVDAFSIDLVPGIEATSLSTTDLGDLLKKSPTALSTRVQKRTPIVSDARVRSSRIGSLKASGSYWVPARADLDTTLSKIDSRLIEQVTVIPGPYSSLHGPSFNSVEFSLLESPRSDSGSGWTGISAFDHQTNGNRWLGLQSLGFGAESWGVQANYAHRYGDDYRDGDGTTVGSGFESRELTTALGWESKDGSSVEVSLLRLDQTDVEFPGYVFDIDVLVTDGVGITYRDSDHWLADQAETEVWYNRTWFEGSSQTAEKALQFPLLQSIAFSAVTDVDSMSAGYRRGLAWGSDETGRLTIGHDLRFVKQELNEIASGSFGFFGFVTDANSPIPRSFSVNPGLFVEYSESFLQDWEYRGGVRLDFVQTDVVDDAQKLNQVGFSPTQATATELWGTDQTQTDRFLGSLYGTVQHHISETMIASASLGYAERPPTLTELYALEPFLLLLQNGLNTVTGDPLLDEEKLLQLDLGFDYSGETFRTGVRGFHAWAWDYITFENFDTFIFNNLVQQVNLKYVNTEFATLAGVEGYGELMMNDSVTTFLHFKYTAGTDRTRRGSFATTRGQAGAASTKTPGLARGAASGINGDDSEPLSGISPLESRVGVRFRDPSADSKWTCEVSGRLVDNQHRVASSLFESETPGFSVWNLRTTYRVNDEGLLIVLGTENLTDKTYREHLDFRSFTGQSINQPGRSFYLGADWRY